MKTLLCQDIASKVEMGDMKSSMKNVKNTFENVFRVSTQPKKCIFDTDYLGILLHEERHQWFLR